MGRTVIRLNIDQDIPKGEVGEKMLDRYITELARTGGELTWETVDLEFYEDEYPDGSLKNIDGETGERV